MPVAALGLGLIGTAGLGSMGGCRLPRSPALAESTIRSDLEPVELNAWLPTRYFLSESSNDAEIVLASIEADQLAPDKRLGGLSGHLVHITMFLRPKPAGTPIATTATTAAVTYIVMSDGEFGVYRGAGFFIPSLLFDGDRIREDELAGVLREATLRPVAATPGFVDRLGASRLTVRLLAQRDELITRQTLLAVDDIVAYAKSFGPIDAEPAEPADPAEPVDTSGQ